MIIKEVRLNNFRIYYGENAIEFHEPDSEKNIYVISGKNGYGKTTFLMSLVWCLYGKQMSDVDEIYAREIRSQGGYKRYISNSLNRRAKAEGNSVFSASVTFGDVDISELPCKELVVERSFNVNTGIDDDVRILIDGIENELANEIGPDTFIRDFILPKEIAKFFLFDAEKIISLAESKTSEQHKSLSKAYSEVLGIKRYEELKKQLEDIQRSLRKETASAEEKKKLNHLERSLHDYLLDIEENERKASEAKDLLIEKKKYSEDIQTRLIKEGSIITEQELEKLRDEKASLETKLEDLKEKLKEDFELIPFAVAGSLMSQVSHTLRQEQEHRKALFHQASLKEVEARFMEDFRKVYDRRDEEDLVIPVDVDDFYKKEVRALIQKHFLQAASTQEELTMVHEFTDSEINGLNALVSNLRSSFKDRFARLASDVQRTRNELDSIRRRLREGESNKEDPLIAELRQQRQKLEEDIDSLQNDLYLYAEKKGLLDSKVKDAKKDINDLSTKLKASEQNQEKDRVLTRQISGLKRVIEQVKKQKKGSLEDSIRNSLKKLMHKKGFVDDVRVNIMGESFEIQLLNSKEEEIHKEPLSMGEKQMYTTALLNALVEESDIDFPIFIDSPLQKFDEEHASNIIKNFYPEVARQVVIFPLINKEMNKSEFNMMLPHVAQTWLIDNISEDHSTFTEVNPQGFLSKYAEIYGSRD